MIKSYALRSVCLILIWQGNCCIYALYISYCSVTLSYEIFIVHRTCKLLRCLGIMLFIFNVYCRIRCEIYVVNIPWVFLESDVEIPVRLGFVNFCVVSVIIWTPYFMNSWFYEGSYVCVIIITKSYVTCMGFEGFYSERHFLV